MSCRLVTFALAMILLVGVVDAAVVCTTGYSCVEDVPDTAAGVVWVMKDAGNVNGYSPHSALFRALFLHLLIPVQP